MKPKRRKSYKLRHGIAFLIVLALSLFLPAVCLAAQEEEETGECLVDQDCTTTTSSSTTEQQSSSSQEHQSHSWFEEASNEGLKFLQEQVFGQKSVSQRKLKTTTKNDKRDGNDNNNSNQPTNDLFGHLFNPSSKKKRSQKEEATIKKKEKDDTSQSSSANQEEGGILSTLKQIVTSDHPDEALLDLVLQRRANSDDETQSLENTAKLFKHHFQEVLEQLQRVLGNRLEALAQDYFFVASAWYLLRHHEERKHASWKSMQHRFMDKVSDVSVLRELHQGLYLSDLAYSDSEEEIEQGLATVNEGAWQLLFCDTKGNPSEPAHFVAVEKQVQPLPNAPQPTWWQKIAADLQDLLLANESDDTLKVLMVIRGTKTLADVLSDGLLEATPFKDDHKAHGGIQKSGSYIVQKQLPRLQQLLKASGRSKLQLLLLGHSLGGGTAAIAAMEFHDHHSDWIDVQAVGFGSPSIVSPALSQKYQEVITTVIADADIIPRMSGASLVNVQLDMMSLDWTEYLLEDLTALRADILKDVADIMNGTWLPAAKEILDNIAKFVVKQIHGNILPAIHKAREEAIPQAIPTSSHRVDNELIPAGTCLHLFRTATGYDAAYTPCEYFSEIEYVPHMVQDHMTYHGYHKALLALLRQQLQDENAVFDNKLSSH